MLCKHVLANELCTESKSELKAETNTAVSLQCVFVTCKCITVDCTVVIYQMFVSL